MKSTPVFFSLEMIVGFDLPTENIRPIGPPPPPPMLLAAPRIMKIQKPMSSRVGASLSASAPQLLRVRVGVGVRIRVREGAGVVKALP